jgi:hypothetical protein
MASTRALSCSPRSHGPRAPADVPAVYEQAAADPATPLSQPSGASSSQSYDAQTLSTVGPSSREGLQDAVETQGTSETLYQGSPRVASRDLSNPDLATRENATQPRDTSQSLNPSCSNSGRKATDR